MSEAKGDFQKMIKKVAAILLLIACLATLSITCLGIFYIERDMSKHQHVLQAYIHQFQIISHPLSTHSIRFVAEYEDISYGNGENCNYFVGELRSYTTTPAQIESFYATQGIYLLGRKPNQITHILFIDYQEIKNYDYIRPFMGLPYQYDQFSEWSATPITPQDKFYLIYLLEAGESGLDINCSW